MEQKFWGWVVVTTLLVGWGAQGALVATYTFDSPSDTPPSVNGVTFGPFATGPGVTQTAVAGEFAGTGWAKGARDNDDYFQFLITPSSANGAFTLSEIIWDATVGSAGPLSLQVELSYGTDIITTLQSSIYTLTQGTTSADLSLDPTDFSTLDPINVKFFAWDAANASANNVLSFDNVRIDGLAPVPEPVGVALGVFGVVVGFVSIRRRCRNGAGSG